MKLHRLIQGSPEWHAHRLNHKNASDAPAMMGVSPYKTREALLREFATGLREDIDEQKQRLFDAGHAAEAKARPLAEEIVGEELYPVVGSEGDLSASFDGLTLMNDVAFEHKALNDTLRAAMQPGCTGADLPAFYQVQMEQQCMVSGAQRVLFIASKWSGDDLIEERHCWYTPNSELAARIRAGWAQFDEDVRSWKPEAVADKPVAAVIEALPALVVNVEGRVLSTNLAAFRDAASSLIAKVKVDLQTDQDFADAEQQVKFFKDGEERLDLVKSQALAQTKSIDELFRTIDAISEEMRQKRLTLDKAVKSRKEAVRLEIAAEAQKALDEHRAALNARLGADWVPRIAGGFGDAMKGLKTVASCREKVSSALANAKIAASELADRLDANRKSLLIDGKDWFFLFADFQHSGNAPKEMFSAVAQQRIKKHTDEEAERQAKDAAKAAAAAVTPAPQPTSTVRPFVVTGGAARTVPAPRTAEKPTLKGGDIGARLGFPLTRTFIEQSLGMAPRAVEKGIPLWLESDFGLICEALCAHVIKAKEGAAAA